MEWEKRYAEKTQLFKNSFFDEKQETQNMKRVFMKLAQQLRQLLHGSWRTIPQPCGRRRVATEVNLFNSLCREAGLNEQLPKVEKLRQHVSTSQLFPFETSTIHHTVKS